MILENKHGMDLDLIAAKLDVEVSFKGNHQFIWIPKNKFTLNQIIAAMGDLFWSFQIKEGKNGFFII